MWVKSLTLSKHSLQFFNKKGKIISRHWVSLKLWQIRWFSWQRTEQDAANMQRRAWRVLKITQRDHTVFKNKGGHTKYWLSDSLEYVNVPYTAWPCVYNSISIFNILVLLAKDKEIAALKTFAQYYTCMWFSVTGTVHRMSWEGPTVS